MSPFRYAQACPVARAAELLAQRWTLLILRELFSGPQRFSDLRRRLPRISSSVLAQRLERLEAEGIAARRSLPPPAAATVYELAEAGRALEPVLRELARWGARFLFPIREGEVVEAEWVPLGLRAFARREPTLAVSVEIRVSVPGADDLVVVVRGGSQGVRVGDGGGPVDAGIRGAPSLVLGFITRALDLDQARRAGLETRGSQAALRALSSLFDASPLRADARGPEPLSPENPPERGVTQ